MNVVSKKQVSQKYGSNERVSTQQVSNECGLKWMWSQTNESQTNMFQMKWS